MKSKKQMRDPQSHFSCWFQLPVLWPRGRSRSHFSGLINDYSPASVKGGPWEMHGQWTLNLRREWRWRRDHLADFSADMTMSDYGSTAGVLDATKGGQSAHTHHIKLTDETITEDMDGCPAVSPATTWVFKSAAR